MVFRFRKFPVFQDSKRLHKEVIILTGNFPNKYYYLADQVRRSSLSVVLNIAEGSSKQSDKDFNRFIATALGSVDETITCIEIAKDLKLITEAKFSNFEKEYESVSKQLGGLSKYLKNRL
ncbi:MAG: S23 ribosomal protein [Candidatus Levybacteria bacterium GW2011_GWC1_40_19]|nr:MAG: S23 ribosomal protein [Candidatus Levybacteria bacterium GW2011_GWA1_39_32]KKR50769.1 MAG: S23 ribosomal protein [Candidatus Levybacteria bacterium GW2011_GWC1_40_19]KKR72996.1 MAG: S23 ribosomal protein [Candidatus Levybacteria bacterium GW2011_GWC2_40_7]KKR93899.1 MAG: S23 ribosomal protein [Candidatus Levybacteria bacterium GW2011_GWA2_41_15]KKS00975.1 MAG: S23 ribosomal protein [Candidatus Levybacteria bacterium GW2011_GWB1_41_21]HBB76449.1 four helix bundle protein [Candidatus Lev